LIANRSDCGWWNDWLFFDCSGKIKIPQKRALHAVSRNGDRTENKLSLHRLAQKYPMTRPCFVKSSQAGQKQPIVFTFDEADDIPRAQNNS
jgi:hypothetical protein